MQDLKNGVQKLADEELIRTYRKYDSTFHTTHEGYAIIKEEVEEVEIEFKHISNELFDMWYDVKNNSEAMVADKAHDLKIYAIRLAAESIQVAAMAQKFLDSFEVK